MSRGLLRGSREKLPDKVRDALERVRQMEQEIRALKDKLASGPGVDLAAGAIDVGGVKVVATKVDGADAGALRNAVDQLKSKLRSAVVVLASVDAQAQGAAGRRRHGGSDFARKGRRTGGPDCRKGRRQRRWPGRLCPGRGF